MLGQGVEKMPDYDLAVDFMDMTDDRWLLTRVEDAAAGVELTPGRFVTVGSEDADTAVAQIIAVDADGNIDLQVLPGGVEAHQDRLHPA